MTPEVIVVVDVGSQTALGADLTDIPSLVKPFDPHCEGLEQLLNDVSVGESRWPLRLTRARAVR